MKEGGSMSRERVKWLKIALAVGFTAVVVLSPTPPGLTVEGQEAIGLLVLVVILFATEPIPLPAVALLIAIYQVVMGLGTTTEVARSFMSNAAFFIMGALMLAVPLTKQGIDRRIALLLLSKTGGDARYMSFGLISTCALLAGFIADHTVAAVMLPVALSILHITEETRGGTLEELGKLMLLSISYGATIGGLFTPSGGGRNVVIIGFMQDFYGQTIGYGEWMVYSLPITLIMIPITALGLNYVFEPEVRELKVALRTFQEELEEETWTRETWMTLVIFGSVLALWITATDLLSLGIIAIMGAFAYILFGLIDWRDYQEEVDWGVVFIYMGALSLGHLLFRTGAAGWMAKGSLAVLGRLGIEGGAPLAAATSGITVAMTNLMSAGATATVVGPIALEMGTTAGVDPVFMGLITAISCAFGYLLVLATPPHAIVYSSGRIDAKDFIKAGTILTLFSFAALFFIVLTWWRFLGLSP